MVYHGAMGVLEQHGIDDHGIMRFACFLDAWLVGIHPNVLLCFLFFPLYHYLVVRAG